VSEQREGKEMLIIENAGSVVAMETEEEREGRREPCLEQR